MTLTHVPPRPLVYVGDAVHAAGYRLGGFEVFTPDSGHEAAAVEQALSIGAIVVLEPALAEGLPPVRLEGWLARGAPPVVIAPRADGTCSPADPAERVRVQLGLES